MGEISKELSIEKLLQIELTTCEHNLPFAKCSFPSCQDHVNPSKAVSTMNTTESNNSFLEDECDPLTFIPDDAFPNHEEKKNLLHNFCSSRDGKIESKNFLNRAAHRHQSSDAICYNHLKSLHGSSEMCQPIARRNKKLLTLPILSRRLPSYDLHHDEILFSRKNTFQTPTTQDSPGSPLSTLLTNNLLNLSSNKSSLFPSQPLSFVNESTCMDCDSERDIDGMLASTSSESVVSCIKTQSLGNGGTESYLANQKVSPWKQFKPSSNQIFFCKFHEENSLHIEKNLSTTDTDTFETIARSLFQREPSLKKNSNPLSICSSNMKGAQIIDPWSTFDDETCLHDKVPSLKRLNICFKKLNKYKNLTQVDIGILPDISLAVPQDYSFERHQSYPLTAKRRRSKLFGEMLDTTKSLLVSALNLFQEKFGSNIVLKENNNEMSFFKYNMQMMCTDAKELITLKENAWSLHEDMTHFNDESHCLMSVDGMEYDLTYSHKSLQDERFYSPPEKMFNLLTSQRTSTSYKYKNIDKAPQYSSTCEDNNKKNSLDIIKDLFSPRDENDIYNRKVDSFFKKPTKAIFKSRFLYNMHYIRFWKMRTYNLLDKLFSLNYTNQSWREYATNIWESLFNITPVFVVLVYIVFQQYRNEEKKKKIFTPLISRLGYIAEMYRELVEFDVLELSYDNPWLLCRGCRYLESHEDDESHSGYVKRMFKKISSCFACFFRYKAFGFAACQLQLFLQMITETFNWNINESLVLQVLENNQFIAPAVVNTKWFRHNIHYHPHTVNVDDMFPAKNGTKTLLNTSYSDAFLEEFEKDQCKENIKDLYILGPTLGVGAEGHVRLCISSLMAKKYGLNEAQIKWDSLIEMSRSAQQKTGETILYTMKITEKNSCESNIQQVYEDLKNLQHPNVLRVHAFYQDKQNYYLLTDFLEGKELITYLLSSQCNNHAFKENQCRAICFQILKSLEYMHQHNLIHRDVKLENFVCSDPVRMHSFIKQESFRMQDLIDETYFEVPRIVLIDFGLTCRANEACYTRPNGTPLYMAPEVLLQGCSPPFTYQTAVDVWAVGIVLYQLLSGQVPFDAKGPLSFIEKVQTIEYGNETNPVLDSLYFTCDALDTFSILRYTDEPLSRCDTYQYTQLGSAEQSLVSKTNMTDTTLNTSRRRCGTRGNVINLEIYKMKRLCLNQPEWYSISDHAKDLLHQLLTPNAKRRVTASEALRHPWFSIEKNVI